MSTMIEMETRGLTTTIRMSGRLQSKHFDDLNALLKCTRPRTALDLNDVTLVDLEIVRFLNVCEKRGVKLLNCPPYIQEWMIREKDREREGDTIGRNARATDQKSSAPPSR